MENYFNYFTEVEECYQRCRETRMLLSPLDWALIESWKEAGVPLEAVLMGVERAFEKFKKRPRRFQKINGLAYCSQSVLQAADELNTAVRESGAKPGSNGTSESPFTPEEIERYLKHNAQALEKAGEHCQVNGERVLAEDLRAASSALESAAAEGGSTGRRNLEELERRLSAVEEKLTASLTRAASVELLAQLRDEVDRGLVSCRREMTAAQIESLGRQFMKKRLFEHYQVPRLSLFFL